MDEMYKNFSIDIHNRLKNTVNAQVHCNVNEEQDKLYVDINRLGVSYSTSVENVSEIIRDGEEAIDKCFTRIVNSYKSFVSHKFFY